MSYELAGRGRSGVIVLISLGIVAFGESLGGSTRVVTDDALETLDGAPRSVYIDFAGSVGLRQRIHAHFTGLAYSCSVVASPVQDLGGAGQLPGPPPVMFFAPAQVKKRPADWGSQGLNDRLVAAWNQFSTAVSSGPQPWLVVQHHAGPQATKALFASVLAGNGDPRAGHIATMLPA